MSRRVGVLFVALSCGLFVAAAPAAAAPPANVTPPVIDDDTPVVGQTVNASGDTWVGAPTSVGYQWRRCADAGGTSCADIAGATSPAYTVAPDDAGSFLAVRATAVNGEGSTPSDSAPTSMVPPYNMAPPTITGVPRNGETLTATDGSWTGTSQEIARQWLRCDAAGGACVDIAGETGGQHVLDDNDLGHTIRVRETATNEGGTAAADSDATPLIPIPVSNVTPPIVAGSPVVGSQLISVIGTWAGTIPILLSRQWQRCPSGAASCADVPGAVFETYTLGPADVGSQMRIVALASNDGGSTTAASALVGPVTAASAGAPPPPALPAPPSTAPPAKAATALAATFEAPSRAKLRRVLAGKLGVRVECTQPCTIVARLVVSKVVSRKWKVPRTVAKRTKALAAAGRTTVRPRFASKTRRRLAPVTKLVVTLVAEARDRAGKLGSRRTKKLTLLR
jgi:hypothetical protein